MKVTINIFPKADVLDPEAETIHTSLKNLGFENLKSFGIGKKITFFTNDINQDKIYDNAKEMCNKLLVNTVIEDYEITIHDES